MAFDPDPDPKDPPAPAASERYVLPGTASAPGHSHVDHIPFLYGTDPLNPMYAPPVLIEDLNADAGPPPEAPDPIPNPEPSSPSLPTPDPGIFQPPTDKPSA